MNPDGTQSGTTRSVRMSSLKLFDVQHWCAFHCKRPVLFESLTDCAWNAITTLPNNKCIIQNSALNSQFRFLVSVCVCVFNDFVEGHPTARTYCIRIRSSRRKKVTCLRIWNKCLKWEQNPYKPYVHATHFNRKFHQLRRHIEIWPVS